jgi:hypothetical protein
MTEDSRIASLVARDRSPKPEDYHTGSYRERIATPDSQIGVIESSENFTDDNLRGYFLDDLVGILYRRSLLPRRVRQIYDHFLTASMRFRLELCTSMPIKSKVRREGPR